jgi:ankyrin repeat protein
MEQACTKDRDNQNVHTRTPNGNTALHIAVSAGLTESVEILLSRGANPYEFNYQGRDCFWVARKHSPYLLPLLEKGKRKIFMGSFQYSKRYT